MTSDQGTAGWFPEVRYASCLLGKVPHHHLWPMRRPLMEQGHAHSSGVGATTGQQTLEDSPTCQSQGCPWFRPQETSPTLPNPTLPTSSSLSQHLFCSSVLSLLPSLAQRTNMRARRGELFCRVVSGSRQFKGTKRPCTTKSKASGCQLGGARLQCHVKYDRTCSGLRKTNLQRY